MSEQYLTHGKRTETHGVCSEKQVTGKLKNGEDSLVRADNEGSKEQKSKLDLISRRDAIKPFCVAPDGTRIPEVDCDNFPVEFSVKFIKRHLLSLPSADAVEVVRCKDCKQRGNICSMRYIEIIGEDERIHDYSTDNGYCSWGERKGGEDE